ncbi:MAG: hypothetical protein AB7P04_16120 [Bacteriovoracia bacterium]
MSFKGFGELQVRQDRYGEPMSEPSRVTVQLSCGKNLKFRPLLTDHGTCEFVAAAVDDGGGKISLKFKAYNPDTGKCEKPYEKTFPIRAHCPK